METKDTNIIEVEVQDKVTTKEKIKRFYGKHKTKILVGGTAVGSFIVGGLISKWTSSEDEEEVAYDYEVTYLENEVEALPETTEEDLQETEEVEGYEETETKEEVGEEA